MNIKLHSNKRRNISNATNGLNPIIGKNPTSLSNYSDRLANSFSASAQKNSTIKKNATAVNTLSDQKMKQQLQRALRSTS